ncbi:hypothetical protein CC85DRAFT_326515 [Cutaneotrichosporon oleaginosum]|uniref:Mid2 domain-containing protein n=1 Tax=Cutaneotrichosporon oleaginosum TaxID=879819 RepID=A0A0J0XTG5_9TREE|nr:uncharacterized protein CC85DRAFT_326515 [Cutaneotrichosporon oleaginosum]KLT44371.1 hypothetical protein CC85DRAFT_326515 [Cutaneotrichosporon oleaginosum]TXT07905.1 hypothetical protein COLE_04829 [Cutaneotrichosporon oleaginosum]
MSSSPSSILSHSLTMLLLPTLVLALGVRAQLTDLPFATTDDSPLPPLSAVSVRSSAPVLSASASASVSISRPSVPSVASVASIASPSPSAVRSALTSISSKTTAQVVTITATASAAPANSARIRGGDVAAIVLGIICVLEAVVIAVLALRTRNLARRSTRLARTLRDLPPPPPPPLIKPMNVVHVAPPPIVRKVSRKAPPKYEEGDGV